MMISFRRSNVKTSPLSQNHRHIKAVGENDSSASALTVVLVPLRRHTRCVLRVQMWELEISSRGAGADVCH